ncbi:armadillo repeat-containing protein 3-like, partial [Cyprinodon tularosa]|uniref:armadillo repeat-containing protein 3-like n=1 Tax=Cyprinodon tularosa TaxID=77115 RepID=UPI0018E26D91
EVTNALKKLNAIPTIIQKLSPEEGVVVHEFATLCLASLSVDSTCQDQIYNNNGIPPIIKLLTSPDPDVTKNSLEIIFNLVQENKSLQAVHELGGLPSLLELLKSNFPVIQHLALKTLKCVTVDKVAQQTFRKEQGLEKLMNLLDNKDFTDLHAEALHVVANCLNDHKTLQLIHDNWGLVRLMDFVKTPNTPIIQSIALKCLSKAALSSECHKILHEKDVESTLVELLSVVDDSVRAAACQAMAAMSVHTTSKDNFRDLGGLPLVVQQVSSENLELREAATQALSRLTRSNTPNALAVYEAGGHEVLIQQLSGNSARTVANSTATLCNMAEQEMIRSSILSHGGIEALVEALKSKDTEALVNTALCVAMLASDKDAKEKLEKAGGLQALVTLLNSNDKDLLQNACFAVNVCAGDTSCAVKLCRLGALEILQEINQSVKLRTNFSKWAMSSLLNSNLPVKYSLMGHLASTDIITSGFYDAGKASLAHKVLTLEELSMQPVNLQRAVIVINIAAEKKKKEDKNKRPPTAKQQKMVEDVSLEMLIKEAQDSILPLKDEEEQYAALARLVSEAMGGAVAKESLHQFGWTLHHSELKFQLKSNIIPIGLIRKGIYLHRALLFKCLSDCMEMSCTLVRGEYNRAWNEVILFSKDSSFPRPPPRRYIVDLMHQPGTLLPVDTPAAVKYQTI